MGRELRVEDEPQELQGVETGSLMTGKPSTELEGRE